MRTTVSLNEAEIRQAISDYIASRAGIRIAPSEITVEVKSKQNFRSEWEQAFIRCEIDAIGGGK